MPTPASPGTNQFRCNACGRYFNTQQELSGHEIECRTLKQTTETGRRELEREDHTHHEPNDGETKQDRFKHGTGQPVSGR
jgi:hypothetical protein